MEESGDDERFSECISCTTQMLSLYFWDQHHRRPYRRRQQLLHLPTTFNHATQPCTRSSLDALATRRKPPHIGKHASFVTINAVLAVYMRQSSITLTSTASVRLSILLTDTLSRIDFAAPTPLPLNIYHQAQSIAPSAGCTHFCSIGPVRAMQGVRPRSEAGRPGCGESLRDARSQS